MLSIRLSPETPNIGQIEVGTVNLNSTYLSLDDTSLIPAV